jgi:hypothetical protein
MTKKLIALIFIAIVLILNKILLILIFKIIKHAWNNIIKVGKEQRFTHLLARYFI